MLLFPKRHMFETKFDINKTLDVLNCETDIKYVVSALVDRGVWVFIQNVSIGRR